MVDFLNTAKHKNLTVDYRRAKTLRQSSSTAEQLLWNALRVSAKSFGFRFRRQHPLHPYIVDFVCLRIKLIVEIDGISHDSRQKYDQKRTSYLESLGYEVLRFSNEDVYRNLEAVLETILYKVQELRDVLDVPLP